MKHIRFFFLLLFLVYTHNASSMQIDIEDVEQVRYQNFDEFFNIQVLNMIYLPCFDDWFYSSSIQDRISLKKDYEELARNFIRLENFEEIYLTLPSNYFSKVILNKVYYIKHQRFLDNINYPKTELEDLLSCYDFNINHLDLDYGAISIVGRNIIFDHYMEHRDADLDNYVVELILEIVAKLRDKKQIESLFLNATVVTKLPENLYLFPNIIELTIINSKLMEVSPEICNLKKLKEITFSFNPIEELPENIGQLENLESLSLSSTYIKEDEENRLRRILPDVLLHISYFCITYSNGTTIIRETDSRSCIVRPGRSGGLTFFFRERILPDGW